MAIPSRIHFPWGGSTLVLSLITLFGIQFAQFALANLAIGLLVILGFTRISLLGSWSVFKKAVVWSAMLLFLIFFLTFMKDAGWVNHWQHVFRKLPFVLLVPSLFVLARTLNSKQWVLFEKVAVYIGLASFMYAFFYGFFRVYGNPDIPLSSVWRMTSYSTLSDALFDHPSYIGLYWCFSLIFTFKLFSSGHFKPLPFGVFFLVFAFAVYQSQARMVSIGLVLVFGAYSLYWSVKNSKSVYWLTGALVLVILGVFLINNNQLNRYTRSVKISFDQSQIVENFSNVDARMGMWCCGIKSIQESPWRGHGYRSKEHLVETYEEWGFERGVRGDFNMHNQYLESFNASGIFGFFSLIWMFVVYLYELYRSKRVFYLLTLVLFLIAISTESMFERAFGIAFFTLIFPFVAGREDS